MEEYYHIYEVLLEKKLTLILLIFDPTINFELWTLEEQLNDICECNDNIQTTG